jgi:hypothetical protein
MEITAMTRPNYPLFIPPGELAEGNRREWSAKQANEYRDWLISQIEHRTRALLTYFGEEYDTTKPEDMLAKLGKKVSELLCQRQFSTGPGERPQLTSQGYALAADMGLLIARLICEQYPEVVRWSVLRKPKSDMSYNIPILEGIGPVTFDPVGGAIAEAFGILRGDRQDDAWLKVYKFAVEKARAQRPMATG